MIHAEPHKDLGDQDITTNVMSFLMHQKYSRSGLFDVKDLRITYPVQMDLDRIKSPEYKYNVRVCHYPKISTYSENPNF